MNTVRVERSRSTKDAIEAKRQENRQLLLTSAIPHLSGGVAGPKDWHVMRVVVRRESQMRRSIADRFSRKSLQLHHLKRADSGASRRRLKVMMGHRQVEQGAPFVNRLAIASRLTNSGPDPTAISIRRTRISGGGVLHEAPGEPWGQRRARGQSRRALARASSNLCRRSLRHTRPRAPNTGACCGPELAAVANSRCRL